MYSIAVYIQQYAHCELLRYVNVDERWGVYTFIHRLNIKNAAHKATKIQTNDNTDEQRELNRNGKEDRTKKKYYKNKITIITNETKGKQRAQTTLIYEYVYLC